MTVSATSSKAGPYPGDGVNKDFPFAFYIEEDGWIEMTVSDVAGVETVLTLGTHYTVSGTGKRLGGTVSLVASYAAPAPGTDVALRRLLPLEQRLDLRNAGRWLPENHEDAFDYLTMLLQQHDEIFSRIPTSPITSDVDINDLIALILSVEAIIIEMREIEERMRLLASLSLATTAGVIWAKTENISANETVVQADNGTLYIVDTSGGDIIINLPQIAVLTLPFNVAVQKNTTDTNSVIVHPYAGDEIEEIATDYEIASFKEIISFIADDTATPDNWTTLEHGIVPGDVVIDRFVVVTDYTAGVTTSLTLSVTPASADSLTVSFDGATQHHDFTVLGKVVTFSAPIPVGVAAVEITTGTRLGIGVPGTHSVGLNQIITTQVAALSVNNVWTGVQSTAERDITGDISGTTINWDGGADQNVKVTLTTATNYTMQNPSNLIAGTHYYLHVVQDGTGGGDITAWGSAFDWGAAGAPTLTATAGAVDEFAFYCNGTTLRAAYSTGHAA